MGGASGSFPLFPFHDLFSNTGTDILQGTGTRKEGPPPVGSPFIHYWKDLAPRSAASCMLPDPLCSRPFLPIADQCLTCYLLIFASTGFHCCHRALSVSQAAGHTSHHVDYTLNHASNLALPICDLYGTSSLQSSVHSRNGHHILDHLVCWPITSVKPPDGRVGIPLTKHIRYKLNASMPKTPRHRDLCFRGRRKGEIVVIGNQPQIHGRTVDIHPAGSTICSISTVRYWLKR